MKKKLRGIKRQTFMLDFSLYRVDIPIPDQPDYDLSVIDIQPEGVEQTIMFIHGYAGAGESWEYQINHFAKNYRVIVPDLRGHGQSDAPYTQYTMDELVADIETITEKLKLPEKFILVGHSFGGSVCVEYANAHPERLDKLVLLATAGAFPLPRAISLLSKIPSRMMQPIWKYRPRWDAEVHVMKRMMLNNLRKWEGWNLLRNIRTDTLLITGQRDNYFPRYVYEDVGKMIPNAEVYDVGYAKHKVQLERYEAVNRAIERFITPLQRTSWRSSNKDNGENFFDERPWLASYGTDIPHTIPIPRQPMHKFLESAAHWKPKQKATIFYGKTLTYEQLNTKSIQFANALQTLGVQHGDRVMVVLPNMPQFVIAYFACLKIGAVIVLPNPDATADRIVEQALQTQAKVVITLSENSKLANAIQQQKEDTTFIFVHIREMLEDSVYQKILHSIAQMTEPDIDISKLRMLGHFMDALIDSASISEPNIDVQGKDLACIVFTSGTTDMPKGVCLTHSNLVANAMQTRHWIHDLEYGNEVTLSVLPLLHSYGMTTGMNVPITIAATMVLMSAFDLQQILENIKKYKPTIFPGVPSLYTAINMAPDVRSYGLSSIKACISGAAPLPVEVQESFEKLTRGRLVEGYGLTEASPVTHSNPLYGVRKVGSIGIPLPNTQAKIVDLITDKEVKVGEIGELLVKGPQIMQGYWQDDSEDPESTIKDGWLYTGDVAVMDSDGYFQIISRKRDTIFNGEFSIYPRDIEEVLYENNKVLEVAVIGVGKIGEDQKVKAFVVPRPGTSLTKEELLDLCRKRLEAYAVPWDIEFRETLPKSFIGKVLRRLLTTEDTNSSDSEQNHQE